MIDHTTGFIHTIAGDGAPADDGAVGDGGPATSAHLNMPSDVAIAPSGDIYIADMHHQRAQGGCPDANHHDRRGQRRVGHPGRGPHAGGHGGSSRPGHRAGTAGQIAIFIADYYNGASGRSPPTGSFETSARTRA
jgi:hypothetical protein